MHLVGRPLGFFVSQTGEPIPVAPVLLKAQGLEYWFICYQSTLQYLQHLSLACETASQNLIAKTSLPFFLDLVVEGREAPFSPHAHLDIRCG